LLIEKLYICYIAKKCKFKAYSVGQVEIECNTYDNTLHSYVGKITIDKLTNFVNNCIVVPLSGAYGGYDNGAINVSVRENNWIYVQSVIATTAHVRCLIIY